MKKKVFALILVLALTLAMMAPVLAAAGDTVSPCACSHVWVDSGNSTFAGYSQRDIIYHNVNYNVPQVCTQCLSYRTRVAQIPEYHNYDQKRCVDCGFVNNSIQSVDDEHTH